MAYDLTGNVTYTLDARGNAWTYSYDPQNRLTGKTDPLAMPRSTATTASETAH